MEVTQEFGQIPLLFPFPTELITKLFFLLFLSFYLVFAILLVRQVHLMIASIKVPLEPIFNFLTYLNLFLTIILLVASILVL